MRCARAWLGLSVDAEMGRMQDMVFGGVKLICGVYGSRPEKRTSTQVPSKQMGTDQNVITTPPAFNLSIYTALSIQSTSTSRLGSSQKHIMPDQNNKQGALQTLRSWGGAFAVHH